jgi:glycosyltransferase involved in cell wall biosynthesis
MIILQVMFSRGLGGLERSFLDHATLLTARGHTVHCLVARNAKSLGELERLSADCGGRLQVHPVPTQGWAKLLLRYRLGKLLAALQPEVIVAHGAKTVSRLKPLRPRHVPLVAITHNASPRLMGGTHLLALTAEMEQLYVARGFAPERIHRVPNVLPARFAGIPQQPDRPLHQPLTVGVLARLVPKKGVDIFLRGLRLALDQGLQLRAVIGGDGGESAALRRLCSELKLDGQVEFLGWVAEPDRFYGAIDFLCVPSRDEPFGIVVLEGFAQGTPVVAAAVGGPRELIQDGSNGLLFAAADAPELAQALRRAADGSLLAALRRAAYAALPRYAPAAVGHQLESVFERARADLRGD